MGESRGVSQQTITPLEYLEELGAYAISIGMPYDLYWYGKADAINNFVKAEQIKQRKKNNELWLQGAYIYQAIGALVPVLNPFSKEHRAKPYLKHAIPLTEEDREQIEREKYERFVNYMHSLVKKTEVGKK